MYKVFRYIAKNLLRVAFGKSHNSLLLGQKTHKPNYPRDSFSLFHQKEKVEELLIQNGRIWSSILPKDKPVDIQLTEFRVFSQGGDDGIIQYLVNYLDLSNKVFIEFGVEDYSESNTRFLLMNNNWSGLILDAHKDNIERIKRQYYYWKYDLRARHAFITKENINDLIREEGVEGQIGLLHIDIDGNDYWVWKSLFIVDPIIVIVEYNSVFGKDRAITVPYKPDFNRTAEHHSNLYFGASLKALIDLAKEKKYSFIGSNSLGNNAFFIKNEFLSGLKPVDLEDGFVSSKFRESRNKNGQLSFLRGESRLESIKDLPVYNTELDRIETI